MKQQAFRFDLCVFPSASLQDGCGCPRQGRCLVRVDVVHGLQNMDLGWLAWVRRRSCPVRSALGATTREGPAIYRLRRDRRFSLFSMLSPLPLCKMNVDVAVKADVGWEFTGTSMGQRHLVTPPSSWILLASLTSSFLTSARSGRCNLQSRTESHKAWTLKSSSTRHNEIFEKVEREVSVDG